MHSAMDVAKSASHVEVSRAYVARSAGHITESAAYDRRSALGAGVAAGIVVESGKGGETSSLPLHSRAVAF
jgi:hypothetical protein